MYNLRATYGEAIARAPNPAVTCNRAPVRATSSSVAAGWAQRMLSSTVAWNSVGSWVTTPTCGEERGRLVFGGKNQGKKYEIRQVVDQKRAYFVANTTTPERTHSRAPEGDTLAQTQTDTHTRTHARVDAPSLSQIHGRTLKARANNANTIRERTPQQSLRLARTLTGAHNLRRTPPH